MLKNVWTILIVLIDDDENRSNIKIINLLVWKKSNVTDRQTAFTRAVCHCILNSEHEGVKIDQAYILDKMRVFLVCIISLFNVLCVIYKNINWLVLLFYLKGIWSDIIF